MCPECEAPLWQDTLGPRRTQPLHRQCGVEKALLSPPAAWELGGLLPELRLGFRLFLCRRESGWEVVQVTGNCGHLGGSQGLRRVSTGPGMTLLGALGGAILLSYLSGCKQNIRACAQSCGYFYKCKREC